MNRTPHAVAALLAIGLLLAGCSRPGGASPVPSEAAQTASSAPMASSEASPSSAAASSAAASSASASSGAPAPSATASADALLATELVDVRTGETFTLAELAAEGPVLLEPMAVWCTNCRAQQHEVKRAHETASFRSVSLDVDLSETAADLAAYADREGFDWRFAMADAPLYRLLQERFGVAATNPPSTPLIVIEADGTVRPLEFGRGTRSADQLIAELEAG